MAAAAAAIAEGADRAHDVAADRLAEVAHVEPPQPVKSHRFAKVFWTLTGLAMVAAAIAAWRKSTPTTDPWAEQPWAPAEPAERIKVHTTEAREVVTDVRHELEDAAEAVGEVAGETVARTREATAKAKEATEKATAKAKEATEKATAKAKEATEKATAKAKGAARKGAAEADAKETPDDPGENAADKG